MVLVGLTIALLIAARIWAPLRSFVETVDLRALALVHVTRFVGFCFLVLHARGALPWAFAVPGGWDDNITAAWVLVLVTFVRPDTRGGRVHYLAWNVFGQPLREPIRPRLHPRPGLSPAAPEGAHASQSRLSEAGGRACAARPTFPCRQGSNR
jgi:hypothetical protein